MPFALETETVTKSYRHGGRVVLTTTAELPTGDTPAAAHLRALALRLLEFAERTHLPTAVAALEQAAASGAAHSFFSYRYAVNLQKSPARDLPCLTLTTTLLQGDVCHAHHALATYWTPDLTLQLPQKRSKDTARAKPSQQGSCT